MYFNGFRENTQAREDGKVIQCLLGNDTVSDRMIVFISLVVFFFVIQIHRIR